MFSRIREIRKYYRIGRSFWLNHERLRAVSLTIAEHDKLPLRSGVINFLLGLKKRRPRTYLEIGVRDVNDNFAKIIAESKYGVDPGLKCVENLADFKMTSDEFFQELDEGRLLGRNVRFDVIFIDGLHLADQVDADIANALRYIADDGFVVVHDCNPPTEHHARECADYDLSPAGGQWNGTVWKAVYRARLNPALSVCVIDTDFGVGVITRMKHFEPLRYNINPYFEYRVFEANRQISLNLLSFEEVKKAVSYQGDTD